MGYTMTRKPFYAAVSLLAASGVAFGADLPVKAPRVAAPLSDWSGFYVGPGTLVESGSVTVDTVALQNQKTSVTGFGGGGVFGYSRRTMTSYLAGELGIFRTGIGDNVVCAPNPACAENTRWAVDFRAKYSNPSFLTAIQNLSGFLPLDPVVSAPGGVGSMPYVFLGARADRVATVVNAMAVNQWKINPTAGIGIETPMANGLRTDVWSEAVISLGKKAVVPGFVETSGTRVMVGMSIHGSPAGGLGFLGL